MNITDIDDISFKDVCGDTHVFEGTCQFCEKFDRITVSTRVIPMDLRRGGVGTIEFTEKFRSAGDTVLRECKVNNVYLCDIRKETVTTSPIYTYTFIKLDSLTL